MSKLSTDENGYIIYTDGEEKILVGYTGTETELTLPRGITKINQFAFFENTNVESVIFPNSVKTIGAESFGCTNLTEIFIPESVTDIELGAFAGCTKLINVSFAENSSLIKVGEQAFALCTDLVDISLPDSVIDIELGAFVECKSLTNFVIPQKVSVISDYAFSKCNALTSIIIPDSVASIGDYAFEGCSELNSVLLGVGVIGIGSYAFADCTKLVEIVFNGSEGQWLNWVSKYTGWDENTGDYTVYYGLSYSLNDEGTAYTVTGIGEFTGANLIIPATYNGLPVTAIGERAFISNKTITNVTIPDSVTSIGSYAFYNCTGLTSITIPDSVTSIGGCAFEFCSGLTSIAIPDSVTSISNSSFANCKSLTNIIVDAGNTIYHSAGNCLIETESKTLIAGCKNSVIPTDGSVTSIGEGAFFGGRTGLESITIPDSVTSIGEDAFYNCMGLTSVKIGNSVTSIGTFAFSGCTGLTSITIPDSVTSIGYCAFEDTAWYNNQPDGLIYAGKVAYRYKGTLSSNNTSIVLKSGTLGIAGYAFSGCTGLTSITIPDSVTSISNNSFSYCENLTNIIVDAGNTIYHSAENCLIETESKTLIAGCWNSVIPTDGSVTSIGKCAFLGCTGLTSITIPDSVTNISESAFYDCTGLTSVTIGNSVTSIGEDAFQDCASLTRVNWNAKACTRAGDLFHGCTNLTTVKIGNNVSIIPSYAFSGCPGLTSITFEDTSIWSTWYVTDNYTDWVNKTNGTKISVENPSTNVIYFTSTYAYYYWYKIKISNDTISIG